MYDCVYVYSIDILLSFVCAHFAICICVMVAFCLLACDLISGHDRASVTDALFQWFDVDYVIMHWFHHQVGQRT